jgi:sugar/nucleoside kinase (ribokinase family)
MVTCQRLGLKTRYLGKVGDDAFGDYSRRCLEEEGVTIEGVVTVSSARNQFAFILIDASTGERTIIWDRDKRLVMLPGDVSRERVSSAKVLLVDGHDAGAAVQAARFAKEAGAVIVMDAERISEETTELVSLADVVIGEKHFPERFTGLTDIKEALVALAGKGPRLAGVTLGKKGALVFCNGTFFHSPAYEVCCRDTTGAGDVFHAAFIRALFEDWDLMRCLDFSNAVAALKCRELGGRAALPSFEEIVDFMAHSRCRSTGGWIYENE